jgi:hypothetical protein
MPLCLNQLFRRLLAPQHMDRVASEQLLGNILACVERNGRMQAIVLAGLGIFGERRSAYTGRFVRSFFS